MTESDKAQDQVQDEGYFDAPELVASEEVVEPAESKVRVEEPVESKPAHDPFVVELAREYGATDEQIAAMSPAELRGAVQMVRRREAEAKKAQPVVEKPAEVDEDDFDLGLKEDDYDPEIIRAMKAMKDRIKQSSKASRELQAKINQYEEREQARHQQAAVESIDAAFEGLGAEYARFIGEGTGRELNQAGRPEYRRRMLILTEAGITSLADLPSPKQLAQKLRQAAETLYGVPAAGESPTYEQAPVGKKTAARPQDAETGEFLSDAEVQRRERWNAGAVNRPTARTAPPEKPGKTRAERGVAEYLKANGLDQQAGTSTDLDSEFFG